MICARVLALLWLCAAAAVSCPAHARPPGDEPAALDVAPVLSRARAAMDSGDHRRAADLALRVLRAAGAAPEAAPGGTADAEPGVTTGATIDRPDRAEAWRLYGLALFFLERYRSSERAFVEYLKLDTDGRLDPVLVPPEAVSFFEEVRARHAAELRRYRPGPEKKRVWALNLLPPAGQFQNAQPTKGWLIAGAGSALLATHVTTFLVLRSWCDTGTGVCASDGQSRTESARRLRSLNLISGALLLGVVAYGVVDGVANYDRRPSTLSVTAGAGSAAVLIGGRY